MSAGQVTNDQKNTTTKSSGTAQKRKAASTTKVPAAKPVKKSALERWLNLVTDGAALDHNNAMLSTEMTGSEGPNCLSKRRKVNVLDNISMIFTFLEGGSGFECQICAYVPVEHDK